MGLARKGVSSEDFLPYVSHWGTKWREPETSYYNPNFWNVIPDHMVDEAGKIIASREEIVPLVPPKWAEEVIKQDPDLMYRGMSADELADILMKREIKSKGDYNFDNQQGLTYFTTDPASAESYANAFAPEQHKPNMERPAYIIAAKRAPDSKITNVGGTATHELGVNAPTSLNDVVGVYRGKTTAYTPGIKEPGFYSAPTARLYWEPKTLEDVYKGRESGGRTGYASKGRVVGDVVDQALKLVMGGADEAVPVSRLGMNYKDVTKRVPELTEAAKRVQAGEIGQPEYSALVDRFKPVEPYASVPEPASTEAMINALTANKREKVNRLGEYQEGYPVALRLDIPAYTNHGVWVPTIHDQKTFKTISHEPAAHIYGAQFSIPENKALAVAAGGAKGPFATIDGSLLRTPPEDIHRRAQEAIDSPEWAQVGMDPERHSYFYDRRTMQPVLSAEEVIQVGPLVLARKPVYGKPEDFKYSSGGRAGYASKGRVVGDVVDQALKLVAGESDEGVARIKLRGHDSRPDWDAVMEDIEAGTSPHPFSGNERIYNDRSTFDISPFGEELHLGDIRALQPNQGAGTELLDFLKGIADKHQVPITGTAKVYHSSPGYISETEKLADWYRKRGFDVGEGYPEDGYEIRYNPKVFKNSGGRTGYQTKGRVVGNIVDKALDLVMGEGDEAAQAGIRAYHGSPYEFYRFDLSKIGTGEGAQAYGHGLYFAEAELVAKAYRDALSAKSPNIEFVGAPDGMSESARALLTNVSRRPLMIGGLDKPTIAKLMREDINKLTNGFPIPQETVDEVLSIIDAGATPTQRGHMYEVNIAADPNQFLDWDKPLSEQPEAVRQAILATKGNLPPNAKDDLGGDYSLLYGNDIRPGQFLNTLEQIGGRPDFGENLLRDQGIPGIKYLDAGSRQPAQMSQQLDNLKSQLFDAELKLEDATKRGKRHTAMVLGHQVDNLKKQIFIAQQPQSRNYVVFDDKLISIIRKYGIAGASAMVGYNLLDNLDPVQAKAAAMADREYQESRPNKASGGEVYDDDDINDALRIAKNDGGSTGQVFMKDANGISYDVQGNVIPQQERAGVIEAGEPENYEAEVKPFIDYAMTPMDRPGMPSEPDLVNAMRVATQVAASGQPTDARGAANLGRMRTEAVRRAMGAPESGASSPYQGPFSYNPADMAGFVNTVLDFSPTALFEVAHDMPYEAVRTGDYGSAAVEGGLNALMTAPGMQAAGAAGRGAINLVRQNPRIAAGIAGAGLLAAPSEAEAGPARWFSKAMEVAQAIPMQKMTGEQALAMLRKGVSPEELRWTGTDAFLSGQKSVSKDDLLAHLAKNRIQTQEIVLGGGNKPTKLDDININDIPAEIRTRHPDVERLSNRVGELGAELKELRAVPDQSGLDYYDHFRSVSQEYSRSQAELMRAQEAMRKEYVDSIGGLGVPTKYGPGTIHGETLTTPGGTNYTENLYALPQRDIYTPFIEQMRKNAWSQLYNEAVSEGFDEARAKKFADNFIEKTSPQGLAKLLEKEEELKSVYEAQKSLPVYKEGHWSDIAPDVLFHTRTSNLTYEPVGANRPYTVHNVEETQSDPGQAGRRRGFKDQNAIAAVARLRQETEGLKQKFKAEQTRLHKEHQERIAPYVEERNRYEEELRQKYKKGEISLGEMTRLSDEYSLPEGEYTGKYRAASYEILKPIQDKIAANESEINRIGANIGDVPIMPFVTSTEGWTDRAIKHELDKALDSDADYFSWTPGEVHADRYDLSRHIGKVQYNPDDGSLLAYNPDGRMVLNESVNDPDELDEYLGEELANKMRAEAESRRSSVMDEYDIYKDEETGEWTVGLYGEPSYDYNGNPLMFGSKGEARDYLNEMIANDLANNPAELSGLDLKVGGEGMTGYYNKIYLKRVQEVLKKATGTKPEIEVIDVQTAAGPRKQLGIRLTDEMREKARFSDFNKGGRVTGENTYDNDNSVAHALALTREY